MRILVNVIYATYATLVMSAGAHAERQVMNDRELAATVAGVEQSSFAMATSSSVVGGIQHSTTAVAKTFTVAGARVSNVVVSSSAFASTSPGSATAVAKTSITPGHLQNRSLDLSRRPLVLGPIVLGPIFLR